VRNDNKCKSRTDTGCPIGICERTGAYDVWKSLKEVFENKGMTSRLMLKTTLLSLKHNL
jgi:hypothetical protein